MTGSQAPAARPLVSVIVPTYNSERFLAEALASVSAQDYRATEVIAIDDGSTDGTLALLRARPEVICLEQPHRGASAARNAGVAVARGSILAFLDSDDRWPAGRLTLAVDQLEAHPELGYVLGRQRMFAEPGCLPPAWVDPKWLAEPQEASNTGVLIVRADAFARVGLFNVGYACGEDTEWLLRAVEAGVPMTRLTHVLLERRLHSANLSTGTFEARRATLARLARESIQRRRARGTP